MIRGDERVKQSEIYRAQQERLESIAPDDEAALEQEIVELARRSRHLERILHPSREPAPHLRAALERLRTWGAQTAYPLLMVVLDLVERQAATSADAALALTYVESYLVRRMACQVPTNNLNRIFNTSPPQIGKGGSVAGEVRRYLSGRRRPAPRCSHSPVLLDRPRSLKDVRAPPSGGELQRGRAGRLRQGQADHRARHATDPHAGVAETSRTRRHGRGQPESCMTCLSRPWDT